jgi:hypothetical protein
VNPTVPKLVGFVLFIDIIRSPHIVISIAHTVFSAESDATMNKITRKEKSKAKVKVRHVMALGVFFSLLYLYIAISIVPSDMSKAPSMKVEQMISGHNGLVIDIC